MARGFVIFMLLLGLSAPSRRAAAERAPAAAKAASSVAPGAAEAERARLGAELDRVNGEIDALKRRPRGLRDDYLLRNRMADAEALAHRLTELDAAIRRAQPSRGAAPWANEVRVPVSPGDDRADLEAKADILADQATRLGTEANRIEQRIGDLRTRRELKRRAGQLERDPFSPLEQVKSRVIPVGGGIQAPLPGGKTAQPPRTTTDSGGTKSSGGSTEGTPAAGSGMGSGPAGPAVSGGSSSNGAGAGASPSSGQDSSAQTGGGTSMGTPTFSTTPTGELTASGTAPLRGVLDPSALAEVRRLEASGSGSASLPALETIVSALRARSAQLNRDAAALRARATKPVVP